MNRNQASAACQRARRIERERLRRAHDAARVAPVPRRARRRARRDGADHRARREGRERRAGSAGLSRRIALQAERAVECARQRPARHLVLPARLRERQAARLRRHADAGPRAQPRARAAHERLAVHEGHQGADRQGGRDRAGRCLARRRHRLQERLHPQARRHQGPEGALGRARRSPRCGRRPGPRSSRSRPTRSTTRCRPAWPMPPTRARAASSPSASTSR